MHVHVYCERGEAKFWLEPVIELAQNYGLSQRDLRIVQTIIEEQQDEFNNAWRRYFRS